MPNQNIETVKRCYEAVSRGDIDAIMACVSGELTQFGVVTSPNAAAPWYLPLTNKSEVPRFFAALEQAVEHTRFEPFAFAAAGDYVYASISMEQRIRKSGRSIAHEVIHRIKFSGGKVVEWRALEDTATVDAAFRG